MNGRIYDPTLGRFLQADPFIQAPENSQSYNRYSYVLNNPLSHTDPSGYFFDKLFKGINKVLGDFAPLVAIGIAIVTGIGAEFLLNVVEDWITATVVAATGGFLAGGIASGTTQGAVWGAFSSVAFLGVGQAFGAKSGFWESEGIAHVGAHATTGGIIADLQGGKFGHGFFSAGITKGADALGMIPNDLYGGAIASAIVGGTASAVSGGKFANGAVTGAFQHMLNGFVSGRKYKKKAKNYKSAERIEAERIMKKRGHSVIKGRVAANYEGDNYLGSRLYDVVTASAF